MANGIRRSLRSLLLASFFPGILFAAGTQFSVEYPPSKVPGELVFGVTYNLWIPDHVEKLRGIIVHQHGCGEGACKGGSTASADLHWQALAKKWDCALLGPYYHQPEKENCGLWCDPRNGSAKTFFRCLADLAQQSGHPELEHVPWCLWGHSGGGTWVSLMQVLYPERIVAIWFRSGTAFPFKKNPPVLPAVMYGIPMMCNPGAKEKDDKRFNVAWTGTYEMFKSYRAKGASIAFAPDPRTGHECGDSRYLAIPFFDACLALRLPEKSDPAAPLKAIDTGTGWLAAPLTHEAFPAAAYKGAINEANWLPNETVAKAWMEYVQTGAVSDTSPPPQPTNVVSKVLPDRSIEVRWEADADLESGLRQFVIFRDDKEIGRVPAKPIGHFGRPLFQSMSFHDTPEAPLPEMKFIDSGIKDAEKHTYRIVSINGVGLESKSSN